MKIQNRSILFLLIITFVCVAAGLTLTFSVPETTAYAENKQITSEADFIKAIQKGESVIYAGDISFSDDTVITINYSLEIIGKDDKSVFNNAHFEIVGSPVNGEKVCLSVKNIIMNGMVDKSSYDFETEGTTYLSMFGEERESKRCIYGTTGYFSLTLENCEISGYSSYEGPAVYIDNNINFKEETREINFKGCSFHDNICYQGTVMLCHEKGIYNIDNCTFRNNTAKATAALSVSNGTAEITNCTICDNRLYAFPFSPDGISIPFPDNKLSIGTKTYNYVETSGVVYLGAVSGTLKGCTISGNTSLFGGGVGFASQSTVTGGSKTIFEDCVISNNTTKYGGAIYGQSYQGATCSFINCCIFGNKAESGSVIYVTAIGPWQKKYAGKVDFIFCTIAGNKANDAGTFEFYDLIEETYAGFIDIKGSFIIDDSPYNSEDNDYNYIATKDQALEDGVITEESLDNFNINTRPLSGSKADITVPYEVYSGWIASSGNSQKERFIGADLAEQTPDSGKSFPYWTLVFPALAVIVVAVVILVAIRKKKSVKETVAAQNDDPSSVSTDDTKEEENTTLDTNEPVDFRSYSYDELYDRFQKAYSSLLTKKEMIVAVHFLRDKSRKEIAQKLGVSDETIKSHLSSIYKKLGCSSKNDFKDAVRTNLF